MTYRLSWFAIASAIIVGACGGAPQATQTPPLAVVSDPPRDAAHPAGMIPFALPTAGVKINALLYTAAGAGPHPTVLLLHGFPGNEQNLDLAQAIRRAGWNVLTMHYRGAWGSPGEYTFTHCLEDVRAALAWLRAPSAEAAPHVDPSRIALVGHSFGGFAASFTAAHDPDVAGAALISSAPFGRAFASMPREKLVKILEDNLLNAAGMHTLGDATSEALADEAIRNADAWDAQQLVGALARRPLLVVSSDDGLAEADDALAAAVTGQRGAPVTRFHFATDHAYSDRRLELAAAVVSWLDSLPRATGSTTPSSAAATAPRTTESAAGRVPVSDAERVIREQIHPAAKRCFQEGLRTDRTMAGRIVIFIHIAPAGEVDSSTVATNTGMSAAVADCVADAARRARFEGPGGTGSWISIPFNFERLSPAAASAGTP
jgi:pimeloyl-ACP methyl ester carboxylesterase